MYLYTVVCVQLSIHANSDRFIWLFDTDDNISKTYRVNFLLWFPVLPAFILIISAQSLFLLHSFRLRILAIPPLWVITAAHTVLDLRHRPSDHAVDPVLIRIMGVAPITLLTSH